MTIPPNRARASALTQLLHAPRFVMSWFGVALIMAINFGTLWSVVELHDYHTKHELAVNKGATDSVRITLTLVNKTLIDLSGMLTSMRATDSLLNDRQLKVIATLQAHHMSISSGP